MTNVWVTGMSQCSAIGLTLSRGWSALLQGKSGIVVQQPFPELAPQPLALCAAAPTRLETLLDATVQSVLANADLSVNTTQRWGISIGSSRGYQAELETFAEMLHHGNTCPSDVDWMPIYSESPAVQVARTLKLSGPVLAPRAACATGIWAIAQGVELIQSGQCDLVIAGAVEAPITPLTLAGFRQMGALAQTTVNPFDLNRTGFALGEGAALLVLERQDHAQRRGTKPYGVVLGVGLTSDAYHIAAPDPHHQMAITTIQTCLQRSHCLPQDVHYIHAHGTGTRLNDATEARLIQTLFPHRPAVSSTKGATGHTLGASGALGSVFCLMALHQQVLPPCVGLQQPAYDLNLVTQALPTDLQVTLCLSFGFGGQNAVIAFAKITN
jgi:3-oxoacyl-[acyl-carrier-protein] synthase II